MKKESPLRWLGQHLAGRIKRNGRVKYYFLFLPVFKITSDERRKVYRLFGIRIGSKKCLNHVVKEELSRFSADNSTPMGKKLFSLHMEAAESRLMSWGLYHKLNASPRYYLIFDCLHDHFAEAIDGWSLFQYLREQNVPAKYVLLKHNKLAESLPAEGDADIILVNGREDFIFNHPELIAGARCVLTSFGLSPRFDRLLKKIPFFPYIFIEHGVTFLKIRAIEVYNPSRYNKILVSSRGTLATYREVRVWEEGDMIFNGMPRWDLLTRQEHEGRNIFIFFTWRTTFSMEPEKAHAYFKTIFSFLANPEFQRVVNEQQLTINIALHHTLSYNEVNIPEMGERINLIGMHEISRHIRTTDLLITDYSSICFDFMYLNIPVIFYHFDFDDEGLNEADRECARYAACKNAQLYNCVCQEAEAVALTRHYAENGFVLEEDNVQKNNAFFWEKQNVRQHLLEKLDALCATS